MPVERREAGGHRVALAALAERVAPVSFAAERTLPVDVRLAELFPERGIVRGRVLACRGDASTSLAFALAAPAVAEGAWLALIDVPWAGLDAACELGVVLERVVAVAAQRTRPVDAWATIWADVVAAAGDGCDLIVTRVPDGVTPRAARAVVAKLRQRGVVLIAVGDPGVVGADGELMTRIERWDGLDTGHGHLRSRRVSVRAGGRRLRERTVVTSLIGRHAASTPGLTHRSPVDGDGGTGDGMGGRMVARAG